MSTAEQRAAMARAVARHARNEEALRMWIAEGNPKSAAAKLGVSEGWLRRCVRLYCEEQGFDGPVQAAYQLAQAEKQAHFRTATHEAS